MPILTCLLTRAILIALAVAFVSPGITVAARRDRLTPTACTVAPRTEAEVAALAAATPTPEPVDGAVQGDGWVDSPVDLPAGGPASLSGATGTPLPGSGESPLEIAWVQVSDTRELPDGRVGAIVVWGVPDNPRPKPMPEANFHIFERVGDRWLVDAEISGNVQDPDAILRRARQGFNEVDSALYAEPTMAGAKFSIEATLMVGFVGNDDYDGVSCEMFIFERGAESATVSAFCRAKEALIGRAAYLDVQVYGPRRGSDFAPNSCEDVAALTASLVFSCTVELPEATS